MKKVLTIGRDPSTCDIVIYDPTDMVSRSHATLRIDGKKYFITDHSTNGTYRNGILLTPNVEYPITRDDEVRFGNAATLDWYHVPGATHKSRAWLYCMLVALLAALVTAVLFLYCPKNGTNQNVPVSIPVADSVKVEQAPKDTVVIVNRPTKPVTAPVVKVAPRSVVKSDVSSYKDNDDVTTNDAL